MIIFIYALHDFQIYLNPMSILLSYSIRSPSHKQAPILILSFHYFLTSSSFIPSKSSSLLIFQPSSSSSSSCFFSFSSSIPCPCMFHYTSLCYTTYSITYPSNHPSLFSLLSVYRSVYSVFKAYRPLPPLLKRAL